MLSPPVQHNCRIKAALSSNIVPRVTYAVRYQQYPCLLSLHTHFSVLVQQVVMLADGLACVIGGPLGGFISDKLAAARPQLSVSRLTANTLVALATGPAGVLAFGWALQAQAHLAIIIIATDAACFACSFYFPAFFSYITTIKHSASAAASARVQSMMVFSAALFITAGSLAAPHLGYGWWFTILACVQCVSNVITYLMIVSKQRAARASAAGLPKPAATVLICEP